MEEKCYLPLARVEWCPERVEGPVPKQYRDSMLWFVYILKCSNGSVYVGSTSNLSERFDRHRSGDGAAHTAKCPPERVIWSEEYSSLNAAVTRERQLKGWSRAKKLALANGQFADLRKLAKRRSG